MSPDLYFLINNYKVPHRRMKYRKTTLYHHRVDASTLDMEFSNEMYGDKFPSA